MRILITGTGGDVAAGIVKCILSDMPQAILFSCDIKSIVPFLNHFEKHFIIPRYDSDNYWAVIKKICIECKLTHFFPTTEHEILIADKHRKFFEKMNILPVVNNRMTVEIATSKYKTAAFLRENGICVPDTYLPDELPKHLKYPLIIKPDFGRGASQLFKANNQRELENALAVVASPVIQAHVGTEDKEFTVGVFSDGESTRSISFRRTLGMRNMSVFVEVAQDSRLDAIAHAVSRLFRLKGAFNIQLRYHEEQFHIFEINPRISSTVAFRHQMGFKDVIWWIQTLSGNPIGDFCPVEAGTIGIKVESEQIFHSLPEIQDRSGCNNIQ